MPEDVENGPLEAAVAKSPGRGDARDRKAPVLRGIVFAISLSRREAEQTSIQDAVKGTVDGVLPEAAVILDLETTKSNRCYPTAALLEDSSVIRRAHRSVTFAWALRGSNPRPPPCKRLQKLAQEDAGVRIRCVSSTLRDTCGQVRAVRRADSWV